ncbi:MAG: alpha-L-fucosidase [Saprospiraceae bacterium]|nr:alpha-L-fucosidase [Saprospiraceae bacterium]
MKIYRFTLLLVFFFSQYLGAAQELLTNDQDYLLESEAEFYERMEWWRDAGMGMFIHWGPYAVPAGIHRGDSIKGLGEWIMNNAQIPVKDYEEYSRNFNPTGYDAMEWVRVAKEAGMKYIVITSKHHDGFCMWDSKVTDYDVMDFSPIKRDLLAELKSACDESGIKLGFYHSIMDWHHADAQAPHYPTYNTKEKANPNFTTYYRQYLKPQVEELVVKYDPAIFWFDGEWISEYTHEQGLEMYNFIRNLKPEIIINNRVDKGRKGMMGMNDQSMDYAGDFGTPEQEILAGTSTLLWESCMTMNDSWGYQSFDHNWKSVKSLIHNMVEIAAKGGNYLLNIGPTDSGFIPEPSIDRLKGIGKWMEVNSEIIYGSRSTKDFKENESIYFVTSKDRSIVFVVTTEWPGDKLSFSKVDLKEGSDVFLLGYDPPLTWQHENDGSVSILIPEALQDSEKRPCDHAWSFKVIPAH